MAITITAVRLEGGTEHRHITRLWWLDPNSPGTDKSDTRQRLVAWIESGGRALVHDGAGHRVDVLVVTPHLGHKYLRTRADGVWTDNLLALPRR